MSIFDSIKSALGGGKPQPEEDVTMAPSQVLRNAGIDTSRLDLSFGTGSITVAGEIADEAERDRILDLLAGIPGIDTIEDSMVVAAAVPEPAAEPEPEPQPEPAPDAEAQAEETEPADAAEERSYTVQSGDTL
jgi:ribosomal protein L12E/L44/L45/RPP1/RPP2